MVRLTHIGADAGVNSSVESLYEILTLTVEKAGWEKDKL